MFLVKNFVLSFIGTAAFALLFQSPKKLVWMCGVAGAVAWCTYIYMIPFCDSSFGPNLVASIALSLVAGVFAVFAKKPMPMFVATGVLPLVPGIKLYQGMHYLFVEDGAYSIGMKKLMDAGSDSIAIALGLMLGVSIFQFIRVRQLSKINVNK